MASNGSADRSINLPLVYSCSGCSSAAQLANALAIQLDRRGHAVMSCIAGVGGDVKPLVKLATSGRPIVAIDGCPLQCVRHTLARHGVVPSIQHTLSDHGVPKRQHTDFSPEDVEPLLAEIVTSMEGLPEDRGSQAAPTPRSGPMLTTSFESMTSPKPAAVA